MVVAVAVIGRTFDDALSRMGLLFPRNLLLLLLGLQESFACRLNSISD